MNKDRVVYVLGSGAVGTALVASLTKAGRSAVAVRTSDPQSEAKTIMVGLHFGTERFQIPIRSIGLSRIGRLDGVVAITAKSYAKRQIAAQLKTIAIDGPIVILQNGVNVEKLFLEARIGDVYRSVLYLTSQGTSPNEFGFHPLRPSLIGTIQGTEGGLEAAVASLNTDGFPFVAEQNIQKEIWKKAIVNAVFNSICPLLEVDNGVFHRQAAVADLAIGIVSECLVLTHRLGLDLTQDELMTQITQISHGSDGQLISTLQDIRAGRETEIDSLNFEMARIAAAQQPKVSLPKTEMLGNLTLLKSKLSMR